MGELLQPQIHRVTCAHPGGLHQIAYREWFDARHADGGAAPVVVCVHGLTRRASDFDGIAPVLAAAGCRVICPDMIGRGDSDCVAQPMLYAIPQYVADCVTLIARLNVSSVSWIGTSMGGLIGMSYAALTGNPIRRLVLNDIGPNLDWVGLERIATYVGAVPKFAGYDEAAAWLKLAMAGFGPHDAAGWELLIRPYFRQTADGGWIAHYDPAIAVPFKALMANRGDPQASAEAMWAMWDAIEAPTMVLRGENSDLLSRATCAQMQSRGPRVTLHEVPGVGHAPTLISRDQVTPVLQFLLS